MTNLTPLPELETSDDFSFDVCAWHDTNRPALESIIAQQEKPVEQHNVNNEPTRGGIDALRADLIARINQADRDVRAIIDHERERVDNRLDVLEARLRDVDGAITAIELRSDETKTTGGGTEWGPQANQPKPKCELCHDHRYIDVSSNKANTSMRSLCPCVKVGDVVSAEVANLLPVGSQIEPGQPHINEYVWEKTERGWRASDDGYTESTLSSTANRRILRIGPAPATTDAPDKAEDHITDASKKVSDFPLADLLADSRLRPLVDVVRAAILGVQHNPRHVPIRIMQAVDALPPELRAAESTLAERGSSIQSKPPQ